jgi:hypothetical protein
MNQYQWATRARIAEARKRQERFESFVAVVGIAFLAYAYFVIVNL